MAEWVKNPQYHGDDTSCFVDPGWCCSECGTRAPTIPYCGMYNLVDICPHCGEKMEYGGDGDG